jgi:hypothetical protein
LASFQGHALPTAAAIRGTSGTTKEAAGFTSSLAVNPAGASVKATAAVYRSEVSDMELEGLWNTSTADGGLTEVFQLSDLASVQCRAQRAKEVAGDEHVLKFAWGYGTFLRHYLKERGKCINEAPELAPL